MKTRFLLLFLFVFTSAINSFSQNQNSVWVFGDSAGIDFSNTANPVTFASGMDGRGSCASIADTNGNLLFYAYTNVSQLVTTILNLNHDTMTNFYPVPGNGLYSDLVIIPKPSFDSLYYLFYNGIAGFIDTTYYALINMNLNGGLGGVLTNNNVLGAYRTADCLTAIQHGNGRDWWIISKYSNVNGTTHNRFYVYLVTSSGILGPSIQNKGSATDVDFQKIVVNSTGTKFMLINTLGFMCEYNFDRCTGNISNPSIIYPEQTSNFNRQFNQGAYSANNQMFYLTTFKHFNQPNRFLLQFDLGSSNIPLSCDTLDSLQSPIGLGTIRLAPDGKIYVSCAYEYGSPGFPYPDSVRNYVNENLSVINYPDSLGAACDYQPSFYLGGKRTYYGLPNNPNYSLGPLAGSPCDTLTGIKNNAAMQENAVSVFPNPVTDKLTITTHNNDLSEIILYDIVSRKLLQQKFTNTVTLNTAQLAKGMYVYEVRNKDAVVRKGKVVKE